MTLLAIENRSAGSPADPFTVGWEESSWWGSPPVTRTAAPDRAGSNGSEALASALEGSYAIEARLGGGGMADVYRAHDVRHDRKVAIKVLASREPHSRGTERFRREIRTAAALSHPHVLPVYDSAEQEGLHYYVMPLMPQGSLRHRLVREGRLSIQETLRILRDVVDALVFVHGRGIVHRDIKPDNVMWSGGRAHLADFGIAKSIDSATDRRLTNAGAPIGTPAYMAPEQVLGSETADPRMDIYSVGAFAYELLTGALVFRRPTPQEVMSAHLYAEPRNIAHLRDDLPARVAKLIMRCLRKNPKRRWQSARELLREIDAVRATGERRLASRRLGAAIRGSVVVTALVTALLLAKSGVGAPATPDRVSEAVSSVTVFSTVGSNPESAQPGVEVARARTGERP